MGSIVKQLQKDILNPQKRLTEILRTAKLIAAKLDLKDISGWIDQELSGYKNVAGKDMPAYRHVRGGVLKIFNPYRGWDHAGDFKDIDMPIHNSATELEDLVSSGNELCITPPMHIPVHTTDGILEYEFNQFRQILAIPNSKFKRLLDAVREEVLNWTIELEKRGIMGEDMTFDENEQNSAVSQTFHIEKVIGVAGNVSRSKVVAYDYSSVHQTLKECGVPQAERNELENIMDNLPAASGSQKKTLIARGKDWIVKNKDFLGTSIDLVKKALEANQ
jgi:hypothetical protein